MMPGPGMGRARTGGFRAFVSRAVSAGPAGAYRAFRLAGRLSCGALGPAFLWDRAHVSTPRTGRTRAPPARRETGFRSSLSRSSRRPNRCAGTHRPGLRAPTPRAKPPPRERPPRRPTRAGTRHRRRRESASRTSRTRPARRSIDAKQLRRTPRNASRLSATSEARPTRPPRGLRRNSVPGRQPGALRDPGRKAATPR